MNNDTTRVNIQIPKRSVAMGSASAEYLGGDDTVVDPPRHGTPLIHLLARGQTPREALLHWVKQGADIHAVDALGTTPLMLAARRGEIDTVMFLVGRGALVNSMDKRGYTAFALAACRGHAHIMAYLKSRGANPNAVAPVLDAIREGRLQTLTLLVENGCSLDLRDRAGNTPLIVAAAHGHVDMTQYLVARGSDRGTANGRRLTALDCSILGGHFRVAALLERGSHSLLRYSWRYWRYCLRRWQLRSHHQVL